MKKALLLSVIFSVVICGLGFGYDAIPLQSRDVVLNGVSVSSNTVTALAACKEVLIKGQVNWLVITTTIVFPVGATKDITINCYTSMDGTNYDTIKFTSWVVEVTADSTVQKTVAVIADALYYKFRITNPADSVTITTSVERLIKN